MYQLTLILHILIAITLISLVLIQHGKGAEMGAAFGSGASNTVFGSQGSKSFLFKFTAGLALVFFVTSIFLSYLISIHYQQKNQEALPYKVELTKEQTSIPK